jgi:hypothetical protein
MIGEYGLFQLIKIYFYLEHLIQNEYYRSHPAPLSAPSSLCSQISVVQHCRHIP